MARKNQTQRTVTPVEWCETQRLAQNAPESVRYTIELPEIPVEKRQNKKTHVVNEKSTCWADGSTPFPTYHLPVT